jgi:hypothetical protein
VPLRAFADIERVIRASWSEATCDPVDRAEWSSEAPARGQCAVTALVVQDLFGGELLLAEVRNADGSRQGLHYWNRLAGGVEVDLTREQFAPTEIVQAPRTVPRPADTSEGRLATQYARLAGAVRAGLSVQDVDDEALRARQAEDAEAGLLAQAEPERHDALEVARVLDLTQVGAARGADVREQVRPAVRVPASVAQQDPDALGAEQVHRLPGRVLEDPLDVADVVARSSEARVQDEPVERRVAAGPQMGDLRLPAAARGVLGRRAERR